MDDRKLMALLTAVRLGSFSRAAEELGYTQSGLTYRMNSLEDELGCKLLRRDFSGVSLTPEGELLLPHVREAAAAGAALREAAKKLSGQGASVRIGTFPSVSNAWMPAILEGFRRENPNVSIELYVETDELRRWLSAGRIDLAFVDRATAEGFEWLPLREEPLLAVVPKSSPLQGSVRVEELARQPFIRTADEDVTALLPPDMARQLCINAADDSAILSMVEQGLGVSIVPELSLRWHSDRLRALPLEPPRTRTLGLALRSLRLADPLTHRFIRYIREAEY